MLCQACGKHPATTHVKTIVNGELSECALCAECAKKMGYGDLFGDWGFHFGALLGNPLGKSEPLPHSVRCPSCGASFEDIAQAGKVGCAECYHTFYDRLIPSIQRIHGNTTHRGKRPGSAALVVRGEHAIQAVPQEELEIKRRKLQDAIKEQRFEEAAVLRDEIKALEEGKQDHA